MIIKKLGDLKPGMTVAEDVLNFQGLILLKKKTEISEKQIRILKSWGVTEVFVSGEDAQINNKPIDSESGTNEKIETKINEKFKNVSDNPVLAEIKKTAIDLLVLRKKRHENKPSKK
jgi:hypothetical protein